MYPWSCTTPYMLVFQDVSVSVQQNVKLAEKDALSQVRWKHLLWVLPVRLFVVDTSSEIKITCTHFFDVLYEMYIIILKILKKNNSNCKLLSMTSFYLCQTRVHTKNFLSSSFPCPKKAPEKQTETFYHIFFQFRPEENQKFPLPKFFKPAVCKSLSVTKKKIFCLRACVWNARGWLICGCFRSTAALRGNRCSKEVQLQKEKG